MLNIFCTIHLQIMHIRYIFATQPFQVLATDQGKRPRTSSDPASIIVSVQRNELAPEFPDDADLEHEIRRDASVNTALVRVQAQDNDEAVSNVISVNSKRFRLLMVTVIRLLS